MKGRIKRITMRVVKALILLKMCYSYTLNYFRLKLSKWSIKHGVIVERYIRLLYIQTLLPISSTEIR